MSNFPSDEWIISQYQTRSLQSIADEIGLSRNTLRNRLIKLGIARRKKGEHFSGKPKSEEQRAKMSAARSAYWEKHPDKSEFKLKISRTKTKTGIKGGRKWVYALENGSMLEYRAMIESVIGRKLLSSEIIHHIDGNPSNNSIENLQIMSQSEHAKLHNQTKKRNALGRFVKETS